MSVDYLRDNLEHTLPTAAKRVTGSISCVVSASRHKVEVLLQLGNVDVHPRRTVFSGARGHAGIALATNVA
jgi:hypothetical protein